MAPTLQAAQILEGSVILLSDVDLGDDDDGSTLDELGSEIESMVGHRKFIIIYAPGPGCLEVWGPDTDLKAKVAALFAEDRA